MKQRRKDFKSARILMFEGDWDKVLVEIWFFSQPNQNIC